MTFPDSLPRHPDGSQAADASVRDDEQLLAERIRTGDVLAFEALFRRYHRPMRALAERLVGSRPAAEDVVQEVFLAIWTTRARWQITTSLSAYLHRCVRNAAARHASTAVVRRSVPMALLEEGSAPGRSGTPPAGVLTHPGPSPLECAESRAIDDHVTRAVAELPPRAREVFALSRREMLTNREIAERLTLSPKTVEMHLTRALAALRIALRGWRND